ncbi:MAG: FMN-binding protein [Oscillospiraceae bacterium]|nr:FMN-binding protein [Oscillospiraceae bacterium]
MKIRNNPRRIVSAALSIFFAAALSGCASETSALTEAEGIAVTAVCGIDYTDFTDISRMALPKERAEKFPAVIKVYKYADLYAFIVKPVAYNGPVTLAAVIDAESGKSLGIEIIEHNETPHYVRDMDSSWFTGRFAGKTVSEYLKLVRLNARADNEIVAITGATVTTEGIINGVNAAFGVFEEYVSGKTAEEVPYMVRFEPGEGDGPVETESLAIRANGVVLAEIGLDEIRALPSVKRTMSIRSTAGTTSHSFRGTLLSGVLHLVDPELTEKYTRVLAVGVDDYISGIDMDEVNAENSVFIMYEDNDEPLLKKNGESGGMRVVTVNDVFGQRFTNYLLEIALENGGPYR